MNIYRNFVFRKIVRILTCGIARGSVSRPVLLNLINGFHKFRNSLWRPGLGFWPVFVTFSIFKKSDKVQLRESQGLSNTALKKWLVKSVPPTIIWKITFFGYIGHKESRNTQKKKKKHHHLRLEVLVSGVYLVVGTKFITPRKSVPWCWGKLDIFGCADYRRTGNWIRLMSTPCQVMKEKRNYGNPMRGAILQSRNLQGVS